MLLFPATARHLPRRHTPLGGREVACIRLAAVRDPSGRGVPTAGEQPYIYRACVGSISVAVVVHSTKIMQRQVPQAGAGARSEEIEVEDYAVWCIPDLLADEPIFVQARSTGLPQGAEPMCMAIMQPMLPSAARSWMQAAAAEASAGSASGGNGKEEEDGGRGSGPGNKKGRGAASGAGGRGKPGSEDEDSATVFPVIVLGAAGRRPVMSAIDAIGHGVDLNAAGAALDSVSPAIMLCPSPSAQLIAIVTGGGHLRICPASLDECLLDCELTCPVSPDHIAWCTENAIAVSWPPPPDLSALSSDGDQAGGLLVCNSGDSLRLPMPGGGMMACALGMDIDSIRVIGQR